MQDTTATPYDVLFFYAHLGYPSITGSIWQFIYSCQEYLDIINKPALLLIRKIMKQCNSWYHEHITWASAGHIMSTCDKARNSASTPLYSATTFAPFDTLMPGVDGELYATTMNGTWTKEVIVSELQHLTKAQQYYSMYKRVIGSL